MLNKGLVEEIQTDVLEKRVQIKRLTVWKNFFTFFGQSALRYTDWKDNFDKFETVCRLKMSIDTLVKKGYE